VPLIEKLMARHLPRRSSIFIAFTTIAGLLIIITTAQLSGFTVNKPKDLGLSFFIIPTGTVLDADTLTLRATTGSK
jgi:hypothetical protein